MSRTKKHYIEWDGEMLPLADVAKKVRRSVDCVRVWITQWNCTNKKKILARVALLEKTGRQTEFVHKTLKGDLTLSQIYEIHPYRDSIKKTLLSGRISRGLAGSPMLWLPILSRAEYKKAKEDFCIYVVPIDQNQGNRGSDEWRKMGSKPRAGNLGKIAIGRY